VPKSERTKGHKRTKGHNAEREVAKIFVAHGWDGAKRSGEAGQLDGDLDHTEPFYCEVRRRETLALPAWIAEVEGECPPHLIPLLIYRRSRMPWQANLPLVKLLQLINER
jgi:hypothetical protein